MEVTEVWEGVEESDIDTCPFKHELRCLEFMYMYIHPEFSIPTCGNVENEDNLMLFLRANVGSGREGTSSSWYQTFKGGAAKWDQGGVVSCFYTPKV